MVKLIFNENNKKHRFNYKLLCSIEDRLNVGIKYKEAIYFMHWLISRIALNLPNNYKYEAFCGEAFEMAVMILDKLKLETYGFDMWPIVTGEKKGGLHTLTKLKINIRQFNKVEIKEFIIDPTFGQFCRIERCLKSGWVLQNGDHKYRLPPDPGYFLSLDPDGIILGTNIINNGFFEFNEENFRLYCNAFRLSNNKNLASSISGEDYMNAIYAYGWEKSKRSYAKDARIPSEIKNSMDNVLIKPHEKVIRK